MLDFHQVWDQQWDLNKITFQQTERKQLKRGLQELGGKTNQIKVHNLKSNNRFLKEGFR